MLSYRPILAIAVVGSAAACGRYGFDAEGDAGRAVPVPCGDIDDALVCSGFEDDDPDWAYELVGEGKTSTDCATPHTGKRCLVAAVGEGGSAARAARKFPATGSGTLHARAHLRIEPDVATAGINLMALDAVDSGVYGPDFNVLGDGRFEVYIQEAGVFSDASLRPVPRGQWFCLRAAIVIDNDGDGSVTASYDDHTVTAANVDTYPNGPYNLVAVGLDWTSDDQAPITVLVDDVVVATSPVPCAQP